MDLNHWSHAMNIWGIKYKVLPTGWAMEMDKKSALNREKSKIIVIDN
jgi:hypothetical protein